MQVEEKKKAIKENLRKLHLQSNLIDSFEYNERLELCEKTLQRSPNRLAEAEKLEMAVNPHPYR